LRRLGREEQFDPLPLRALNIRRPSWANLRANWKSAVPASTH